MKSTGVVRKIDELGRIVLPKELRTVLNIDIKDPLEIFVDGKEIILKKYEPGCIFCESLDCLKEYEGNKICVHCREKLKEIL